MKKPLIIFTALLFAVSCKSNDDIPTIPKEKPEEGEKEWALVWSDEFDKDGLPDSEKWSYDTDGNAWKWGNNEAQYYTANRKKNAYVDNGTLKIVALKEKMEGFEYTSARLRSKGKGDWLYGRFETRAKLPTGLGTWSAIWMLPTDWAYGEWPASGEIDIMENVGYDADNIVASAHTKSYNHIIGTQKTVTVECATSYTQFHTYVLEWEKDEYRVYIDEKLIFVYKNDGKGYASWPFDKRFHMLLNLAIGGDWGGQKGIDDTKFPHVMEIDYVRVYQKK